MSNNVLSAILNIGSFRNNDLRKYSSTYLNRINAVGEQLEFYIKDAISGTFKKKQEKKEESYMGIFSYLGNQNNPPDMIIKKGDAFEIKKIESPKSHIALNSSPPKDVLRSADKRVTNACRGCEERPWKEKDLFYVIGHVKDKSIKYLFFIQGTCYAASHEVYDRLHQPLKEEIDAVLKSRGVEKVDTVELGKVKVVDPLGITDLRIRGMWHIQNPFVLYSSLINFNLAKRFSLFALMDEKKYKSFPSSDIRKIQNTNGISIKGIKIRDPNNPAKPLNAKLILFSF